jgi:ketosteroid isomerase-like protein
LIELAVSNAAARQSRLEWQREQDQALKRRLAQLQVAYGVTPAPSQVAATLVIDREDESVSFTGNSNSGAAIGQRFGWGTLGVTAVASALGGAALTGLLMSRADTYSAPLPAPVLAPLALAPASAPAPALAVTSPAPGLMPDGDAQARALVERWRLAWASRDVQAYLDCYSPEFVPADGQARPTWEAARRKNLASRSDIRIGVSALRLERLSDNQIKAFFLQDYAAGSYQEHARAKSLLLVRRGENWQIAAEEQPR